VSAGTHRSNVHSTPAASRLTTHGALRVPEVALLFWIVKGLSTALGESTSDALVNSSIGAQVSVVLGFFAFLSP